MKIKKTFKHVAEVNPYNIEIMSYEDMYTYYLGDGNWWFKTVYTDLYKGKYSRRTTTVYYSKYIHNELVYSKKERKEERLF